MARPRKLNADWFPHDVNERNKPMVKAIRRKFSLGVCGMDLFAGNADK